MELACERGTAYAEWLLKASSVFGDIDERYDFCLKLIKEERFLDVAFLINARNIFGFFDEGHGGEEQAQFLSSYHEQVRKMLQQRKELGFEDEDTEEFMAKEDSHSGSYKSIFMELLKNRRAGKNISSERFETIKNLIESDESDVTRDVADAYHAYKTDDHRFNTFLGLLRSNDYPAFDALAKISDLYGDDNARFDVFVRLIKSGKKDEFQSLAEAYPCYGADPRRFKIFADLVEETDGLQKLNILKRMSPGYETYSEPGYDYCFRAEDWVEAAVEMTKDNQHQNVFQRDCLLDSEQVKEKARSFCYQGKSDMRFDVFANFITKSRIVINSRIDFLKNCSRICPDNDAAFKLFEAACFSGCQVGDEQYPCVYSLTPGTRGEYLPESNIAKAFEALAEKDPKYKYYASLAQKRFGADYLSHLARGERVFCYGDEHDLSRIELMHDAIMIHGNNCIDALINANLRYIELSAFERIMSIAKKHSTSVLLTFIQSHTAYNRNQNKLYDSAVFRICADLCDSNEHHLLPSLARLSYACNDSPGILSEYIGILRNPGKKYTDPEEHASELALLFGLYGDSDDRFKKLKAVLDSPADYPDKCIELLQSSKDLGLIKDDHRFDAYYSYLTTEQRPYSRFFEFMQTIENIGYRRGVITSYAFDIYFEYAKSLTKYPVKGLETLSSMPINERISCVESSLLNLTAFFEYAEAGIPYDSEGFDRYIMIYRNEGPEKAEEWIYNLKENSKLLIGPTPPPEEIRKSHEFGVLMKMVFPKGDYSNHQKNWLCGDQLEHVEEYKFDREGYPVVLTGLLGYKLKDGTNEDLELLSDYTGRIERVQNFILAHGPDKEPLKKAFDKKVDDLFDEKALPQFKEISDLNTEGKMVCIFISETMRVASGVGEQIDQEKAKLSQLPKPQEGEPDPFESERDEIKANIIELSKSVAIDTDVLDLVITYKYAYQEDMRDYVQNTADSIRSEKDPTTQHYMLWNELSTIYGENTKHLLRHDIFESFMEDADTYNQVMAAYQQIFAPNEEYALNPKQQKRINNTFHNEKIPSDRRFGVLKKQLVHMFCTNLDFDSQESKDAYRERFDAAISELESHWSIDVLNEQVLPALFSMRAEEKFKINAKLEELFAQDINLVFAELAKYDEIVEVEEKERRMGGSRDKTVEKSRKKRHIRGFFTKTAETASSRMGAYLCLAGDGTMWENPNYFELVLKDEDTGKCVGLVMLLNVEGEDGKKYLWFGPNPFESFMDQVSAEKCYQYMYDTVCNFAHENGYAGVGVPAKEAQILGHCTNRGGQFPDLIKASRLRNKDGSLKIVKLNGTHVLGHHNGSPYSYDEIALISE